jgi:hypothetical protein
MCFAPQAAMMHYFSFENSTTVGNFLDSVPLIDINYLI